MLNFTFRLGKDFKEDTTVTQTFVDLMNTLVENSNKVWYSINYNIEREELFTIDADFIPELLNDTLAASNAFEDYENKRPEFDRFVDEFLKAQEKAKFREITATEVMEAAQKLANYGNNMINDLTYVIFHSPDYLIPSYIPDHYSLAEAIDFLHYICLCYYYDETEKNISSVDRGLSIRIIKWY